MAEANINDDGHGSTVVAIDQWLEKSLDLVFVDDVSELRCKRCKRVHINNYVANCGHLFCSNCKRVLSTGEGWKCPDCKEYIMQFGGQDIEVEERVFGLMVHCLNYIYGCKQTMPLCQITTHLEVCEDTKEANLPMIYTGANSMEAVMKRICEISQELKQLREMINKSNTQTQDHLKKLQEADDKQRTDNGFKWGQFESEIKGLRTDLRVETTRLQNLIKDKLDYTNINRELEAKRSEMEKTANHNKHQVREQLLPNNSVIENHIQHPIRDTNGMEALEPKVDRSSNRFMDLGKSLKQEQLNQEFQQMDDKQETTKNDFEKFHANMSKFEGTVKRASVKQHIAEMGQVKEQRQSYKQTERKTKQVEYPQLKDAVEMKKPLDRQNKPLTVTKSQMITEELFKQHIREMEAKMTRLGQLQNEMSLRLNENVEHVNAQALKVQALTVECGQLRDSVSQMTALQHQENVSQGLDNSASDFEMPVEKMKHEENIQQNIDRNGDLIQLQTPPTNEFGEGKSHIATKNKGSDIRKTKSISKPESLNKQPKTKGKTNANQRPIEIGRIMTELLETVSYTYNEFIKRPTKYNVPEYNILLMAESAAEETKFINCFEVLTKYTNLDAALNSYYPLKPLISTPFKIDGTEIATARVEGIADLKKKQCHEYLFQGPQGYLVRLIDSAGYGTNTFDYGLSVKSAKGLKDSNEQMTERGRNILYGTRPFIEKLRSLHSIVIVMKSTEIKLSTSFLDSLKGCLAHFNKSRVSNLLFVITDCELKRYKVDKVAPAVEKILKHIAPTSVVRATHSIHFFLIYNDGLRCMVAHNSGEQLSDKQMVHGRRGWQMAVEQCQSLVTRVQQLQPWREEFLSSIFKKKPVPKLWK